MLKTDTVPHVPFGLFFLCIDMSKGFTSSLVEVQLLLLTDAGACEAVAGCPLKRKLLY